MLCDCYTVGFQELLERMNAWMNEWVKWNIPEVGLPYLLFSAKGLYWEPLANQDFPVSIFRILIVSTSSFIEEQETKVHCKISEKNVSTVSLYRIYKLIFSDSMLVLLPDIFTLKFRLLVTLMKVWHGCSGMILCYPC